MSLPQAQALTADTLARDVDHGHGVWTEQGNDIEVRLTDGTGFMVDLDHDITGATVGDLLQLIRDAAT
ncbi:MAG: hypothetical protein GWO04_44965, partial [Actinobacteria bacterium]|nr:hypothetical protein [Actinomycetota bacterium]